MAPPSPKKYRTWKHRLAAVALGIGVIAAAEGICRLAGWGKTDPQIDPFVSFSEVEPLFELDTATNYHQIRKERQPFFVPGGFAAEKTEKTFRIFCFGGSTVQGRPYSTKTAYSRWLQLGLKSAHPDRTFEVVNCGGISYASYRLVPILTECLAYEPDLFILCTGHNEFLEDRTYASVKHWHRVLEPIARPASKSHLYRSLARLVTNSSEVEASRPILKSEVDALLDYQRGLEAYHRDDKWRAGVIAHFNQNLRRMIQLAGDNEVPMLVLAPPANIKDCPPFKSEPTTGLTPELEAKRDQLLALADTKRRSSPREAAHLIDQAVALDEENAGLHFALGHAYLACGDHSSAQRSLATAMELDICPLRMLESMRSDMEAACRVANTRFIDLQKFLERTENTRFLGTGILVDHIHPSIRGHQLIANKIAETLERWVLPAPVDPEWPTTRSLAYKVHLDTLDPLYYAQGKQRLENLQHWTEGRADGIPIEMHRPVTSGRENPE